MNKADFDTAATLTIAPAKRRVAAADNIRDRLLAARDHAAILAWANLGRYKFDNFGYWAAKWVTYNSALDEPDRAPNPFSDLVTHARERFVNSDVTRQAQLVNPTEFVQLMPTSPIGEPK